jgi:cytoskeletal protein CcmA (bactofilin family)
VVVAGNVTGDVQAFGATVRVTGTVGGSLVAYGGSVELADSGRIEKLFNTGGSRVLVNGTVNSSVQATGGRVILGESATVAREMAYDAALVDRGGSVAGDVSSTDRFLGPLGTLLRGLRLIPVLAPLLGLVAGLAGRRWLSDTAADFPDNLTRNPLPRLLSGLSALLAVGALALLLVVSLVGLPLVVVLVCLAGLGGLLGLAVTQWAVGRVVLDRVAGDLRETALAPTVGAGLGLLVGSPVVVGGGLFSPVGLGSLLSPAALGGLLSPVCLGLLAVASVAGVGAVVSRVREESDRPTITSRFG